MAAARERARETVVVRRRRARRIDDCHTHCGDDTSVSALAREHRCCAHEARARPRARGDRSGRVQPAARRDHALDPPRDGTAGVLRAPARRQERARLPDVQVPDDGAGRDRDRPGDEHHRGSVRPSAGRSAHHAQRPLPAAHEPGRAAAAAQRRPRRDEHCRSTGRHSRAGRELHGLGPAPARGQARDHRLGAGQRPRRDPVAEALRARRVVHRALVARARREDRGAHGAGAVRRPPGARRRRDEHRARRRGRS